ncbi:MAG: DUF1579 domain-containing protein [Phycisphaerae bacterium]|nr:DUF1579 domain-containing protein [Phycisphaerae bacterium]
MKRTCSILVLLCGLVGTAMAQDKAPAKPSTPAKPAAPATPATPAAPSKDAAPAMPPEQAAMMEAWTKAMTPGKHHERLVKQSGTWEGKMKMWMEPGGTPTESTCTTVISPMMGGRFVKSETTGMMNMGGPPMPFEGFGTWGYNNTTEKYEGTWFDNFGTMTHFYTGTLSDDGKTMTATSKFLDPMTGQDSWMRNVERTTGPDSMVLEIYSPGPDGKEFKMLEIAYTRKATAKAEGKADAKTTAKTAGH